MGILIEKYAARRLRVPSIPAPSNLSRSQRSTLRTLRVTGFRRTEESVGSCIERIGQRKGEMKDMMTGTNGRSNLEFVVPARGLIGFRGEFMRMTRGDGL